MPERRRRSLRAPRSSDALGLVDLNDANADALAQELGCPTSLAHEIVAHRPFARPEDVWRHPDLWKPPEWSRWRDLVIAKGRGADHETARVPGERKPLLRLHGGCELGLSRQGAEATRVYIRHPLGVDLISAEVGGDVHAGINVPSIQWLGMWPHELMQLDSDSRKLGRELLLSDAATEAALLWRSDFQVDSFAQQIGRISRDLDVLAGRLRRATNLGRRPRSDWDWVTNGCTGSPDGWWVVCCNEHDLCYSLQGHTSEGKTQCDDIFRNCVNRHAGSAIGEVYHAGVAALGWVAEHVGDPIYPETPKPDSLPPPGYRPGFPGCDYSFIVRSVDYVRADIGINDWDLEFGGWPTDITTREHFHLPFRGHHDFPETGVVAKTGRCDNCGDAVRDWMYIRSVTTEIGKLFFFEVHCDGRRDECDLWMPVKEGSDARLKIAVTVSTFCGQHPPV